MVSPGPVVNQLDDTARETFATGRPLEDSPDLQQCKHCKKSILKTAAKAHIAQCLKLKKEKAQRKKEAREARERAKEAAREEEARKADEENGEDDSDDDDKKGHTTGRKSGKKPEDDKKGGKKRKAEGEPEKGPKAKKKKDEPKPKVPKPKGTFLPLCLLLLFVELLFQKGIFFPLTIYCRPRRRGTTMRCYLTKRPTMRAVSDLQKSLYGRKKSRGWSISTI